MIAADNATRAEKLEHADTPDAMVTAIQEALVDSLNEETARFGWEQACGNPENHRAVIQFPVTEYLFDWFFNARTGYRAHYRAETACGLELNAELIDRARQMLNTSLSDTVKARLLNAKFEDCGTVEIQKTNYLKSLDVYLSKIWFCTKLITGDGGVNFLPLGITGPKLLVGNEEPWSAPYRESKDSWLDMKGAFLGDTGPYQPKDPQYRAEVLHSTGEA